ncbi:hypothetical protein GQ457_17G010050 [Hibiscus cannabinus]
MSRTADQQPNPVHPRVRPAHTRAYLVAQVFESGLRCDEGEDNTIPFRTWKDFQYAFNKHFYPKNAQQEARAKMCQLKHDGNIIEYVRKFTKLKLQLPSLSEDEGYFDFTNGLQKWARIELERRDVTSFSRALTVAETLAPYENKKSEPTKPKPMFKGNWGYDKDKSVKHGTGKPSGGNGKPHREFIRKSWEKSNETFH